MRAYDRVHAVTICDTCGATWDTTDNDTCNWCATAVQRMVADQRHALLSPEWLTKQGDRYNQLDDIDKQIWDHTRGISRPRPPTPRQPARRPRHPHTPPRHLDVGALQNSRHHHRHPRRSRPMHSNRQRRRNHLGPTRLHQRPITRTPMPGLREGRIQIPSRARTPPTTRRTVHRRRRSLTKNLLPLALIPAVVAGPDTHRRSK